MISSYISNFANKASSLFNNTIVPAVKPYVPTLTESQQKVATVAAAVFALFTTAYVIRRCFKAKRPADVKLNAQEIVISSNGDIQEGKRKNGLLDGPGTIYIVRETRKGEFKEGRLNGQGTIKLETGAILTGEFRNDQLHGEGQIIFADGEVHTGCFVEGKLRGSGKITREEIVYEGEFLDGQLFGEGKITLANGDVYKGEFVYGVLNGLGVIKLANGITYTGHFYENLLSGHGKITLPNKDSFEGHFVKGQLHGEGRSICGGKISEGLFDHGYLISSYRVTFTKVASTVDQPKKENTHPASPEKKKPTQTSPLEDSFGTLLLKFGDHEFRDPAVLPQRRNESVSAMTTQSIRGQADTGDQSASSILSSIADEDHAIWED